MEAAAIATSSAAGGGGGGDNDESPAMMRIYIGGVSVGVTESDIEKTFSSLGRVAGVELVRTNDRSFAYMDFQPSSQKSLAKLFSTYNGCTWKGGKLKLEKAKEHYLARLKREWDEDIKLMSVTPVDPKVEPDAVKLKSERSNLEDTHLRIFFPKLRKVKSLPFKGSGKHKYSFQRVEVPSLPLHFCDCEEHSKQSEADNQKYLSSLISGIYYEKELSVMESVMNKLFEKEKNDMAADRETELTTDEEGSESSVDDICLEETDTVSDMDDDNIVTNIGMGRIGDKLMRFTGANKLSANQKSLLGSSRDGLGQKKANSKKRLKTGGHNASEVTENRTEHPIEQGEIAEDEFSAILHRNKSSKGHTQEPETFTEPPPDKSHTELSTSDTQSTKGHSWLQKSAWRDLVGQAGSSSFSISHVVPDFSSVLPTPKSNNLGIDTSVSAKKKATETQSARENLRPVQVTKHTLPEQAVSPDQAEMPEEGDQVEANQVSDEQKELQRTTSNQESRRAIPKVVISDTCTFMRSAESEKEWAKARTALSGYIRKKKKREEKDGPKSFRHMPCRRN